MQRAIDDGITDNNNNNVYKIILHWYAMENGERITQSAGLPFTRRSIAIIARIFNTFGM